MESVMAQLALW